MKVHKTRAEAIESAISELEVGDNLIISSKCGRVEYILELKSKEENVSRKETYET